MTPRKTSLRSLTCALYSFSRWEHGYFMRHLHWGAGQVLSMQDRLDGAIGNKAGYGNLEAAERIEQESRALLARGIERYWHFDSYKPTLHMTFQRVSAGDSENAAHWCQPTFDMGRDAESILRNTQVLAALVRKHGQWLHGLRTPEAMAEALGKLAPTYTLAERDVDTSWIYFIDAEPKARRKAA